MVRDVSGFRGHARYGRRGCFNLGIDFNLNGDRWDVVNPVRGHDCAPNTSPRAPIARMKMEKPDPGAENNDARSKEHKKTLQIG